jgi:monofunctional biosynthetic peptidoglycan transglycosylase
MKIALLFAMAFFTFIPSKKDFVINFGNAEGRTRDWVMISDNVMGGVTQSKLQYTENSMVLNGTISLDNYGGFSSVKTNFNTFDLSGYDGVKIRYKSTGQKFAFTLEDSKNWTMPNYKGAFSSSDSNTWEEATIFFKDFKQYQIGEPTGKKLTTAVLKNIVRLGIITTEKKEGPFSIEVESIEFISSGK